MSAHERLVAALRGHALVIGEVTLTSGAKAQYLIDARRAILRPDGFTALSELVANRARAWDATAVGGLTMGADPIACAALAGGADVKAFFVRKEAKDHGSGPAHRGAAARVRRPLPRGRGRRHHRRLDDQAIDAVREAGHEVCGVVAILDRLAGGVRRHPRRDRRRALRGADHDRRRLPRAARPLGRAPNPRPPSRGSDPSHTRARKPSTTLKGV